MNAEIVVVYYRDITKNSAPSTSAYHCRMISDNNTPPPECLICKYSSFCRLSILTDSCGFIDTYRLAEEITFIPNTSIKQVVKITAK